MFHSIYDWETNILSSPSVELNSILSLLYPCHIKACYTWVICYCICLLLCWCRLITS